LGSEKGYDVDFNMGRGEMMWKGLISPKQYLKI
jgi:hypothetical protein